MFIVVVIDSGIDVRMQRVEFGARFLAERDFVKFLFDRSMETFAEAIGLRTVCFCPRTLDVIDGQEQLIVAPPWAAAGVSATVCQDTDNVDAVIEGISSAS
jgi:hypothetical protein